MMRNPESKKRRREVDPLLALRSYGNGADGYIGSVTFERSKHLRGSADDLPGEIHVHAPGNFIPEVDAETLRRVGPRKNERRGGDGDDSQRRLRAARSRGSTHRIRQVQKQARGGCQACEAVQLR